MKQEKELVWDRLKDDSILLALLAANAPFHDKTKAKNKVNSIIPAGQASGETLCPFITIQGGVEVRTGTKYYYQTIYIRAYDYQAKSYVAIDKIMQRIKQLLDGATLPLTESRLVSVVYESSLPELTEEGLKMNFREATYRLNLL